MESAMLEQPDEASEELGNIHLCIKRVRDGSIDVELKNQFFIASLTEHERAVLALYLRFLSSDIIYLLEGYSTIEDRRGSHPHQEN